MTIQPTNGKDTRALQDELRKYILENHFLARQIDIENDDSFISLGAIDSTGILELVSYLEGKYSIEINAEELTPENLDSINRVTSFISGKRAQQEQLALPDRVGEVRADVTACPGDIA